MTLEDFFTLTEMKNGLTTCARVEELICVMQKLNCVTNNVGDAARQWSTAARTLASTQNKECLSLFVHLNGLGFLNHWLQEADKCSRDVADGEELINTLIGSLDKLPMNLEKLRSSGIFTTVEKLFGHTNVNIKERARMLFDKWNNGRANDNDCQDMEKDGSYPVGSFKPSCDTPSIEVKHAVEGVADNSSCQTADEGSCKADYDRIQNLLVTSGNDLQSEDADDVKCSALNQILPVLSSIENEHQTTTLVSDAGQENFSQEGNFIAKAGMASSTTTASPEIQMKDDDSCNTSARNVVMAELNNGKGDSSEFRETSSVLSSSGLSVASDTKNSKVVRSASCNLTLSEGKPTLLDTKETLHRCASVDGVLPEYLKTMKDVKSGGHDFTDILGSSKGSSCREEATEDNDDMDHCNEPNLNICGAVDNFIHDNTSKTLNDQVTREMEKSSDSEPESGEMDALEIARLVAIEVEREVVDYREELCSSSPETSSNEVINTESPSIEEGKQGHPILGEANGNVLVPINDECDAISSPKDDKHMLAELATGPSKQEQILEESQNGTAVFQDSGVGVEMGKFDFDLNEDACTEDIDCSVNPVHPNNLFNLSAPIAVSASKGAPAFLITPLCFEGGLGWRGSAATSAFRPASPRRAFDVEKSEVGSKYKSNLIELDLNVTDCENYLPVDTGSVKEVPVSSGMPSWNSSSEVSSLRAERIKLDLNSNGEDEVTPSQSPHIKHHFLNGGQSSSPASSSSLRQPPRTNFDLNDNLFSSDAAVSKNINLSKPANHNGVKTDDPVITIMGSRMSVERRAHTNQAHQPYIGNGLSFDPALPTGPMLPYPHQIPHPSYGYVAPGTGMALPFQPAVYGYGNIPHMVDSRGATVVPQLLSSAGANGAPLSTLPYLMSLTNTPSSSNGGGPSHPGLDLNFGMMQVETGTAEMGNMKHPLMPGGGHPSLMEEQINGSSLKRKEPESGWDPYSFGYKHLASWH